MHALRMLLAFIAGLLSKLLLVLSAGILAARSAPSGYFQAMVAEHRELALALLNTGTFALPQFILGTAIAFIAVGSLKYAAYPSSPLTFSVHSSATGSTCTPAALSWPHIYRGPYGSCRQVHGLVGSASSLVCGSTKCAHIGIPVLRPNPSLSPRPATAGQLARAARWFMLHRAVKPSCLRGRG